MILLLVWLVPTGVSAAEDNVCGDNLTWDLSGGVLTISGTGAMYDYVGNGSKGNAPWANSISWITSVVVEEGVTYIGANAFPQYHRITSITLPSTLETIGYHAFWNCNGLKSLTIPEGVKALGEGAFHACYSLESISFPSTLEYMGSSAVSGTPWEEGLTEEGMHYAGKVAYKYVGTISGAVEIADGTTHINSSAFRSCTGLTQVDLPDSLRSIGWGAFYGCSGLVNIELPDSMTTIEEYAFYGCSGIKELNLGNVVTNIGTYAFYGCSGIAELTISNSGTVIGDYAFYNCEGLKELTIPETLDAEAWSFSGTTSVEKLYFVPGTQTLSYDSLPILGAIYMVIPDSVTQIQSGAISRVFNTSNNGEIYILGNPEIAEDAFVNQKNGYTFDVTADVYTFTQWDEADKQNYGGTLTWKEGSTNVGMLDGAPYWYDLNEPVDTKWFTYGCADSNGKVISDGTVDTSAISAYDNRTTGLKTVTVTVGAKQCEYTYHVIDSSKIGPDTFTATTDSSLSYTGAELTPVVTVYFQDIVLEEGRDYTLKYSDNLNVGASAQVTVTGKGMFAGQSAACSFSITKRDLADTTITVSTSGLNYTGTAKCPQVTVTYNDITLKSDTDYILSYANNAAQGEATVTVIGIGNFCGQQTRTFTITEPADSDYVKKSFGSGTIYVRDQTIQIDLGDSLLSGYTLYKNGVVVSHSSIPSSASSVSRYEYIYMSSHDVGTYELVVVRQGYTMIVSGGRYIYKPSGTASSATYTVYRQADRSEMTDTLPTAITAQPGQWLNVRQVYLPVTSEPAGANLFPQTWESSDTEVATVENGIVTLHKAGKATITLTVNDLTATWEIDTEPLDLYKATVTAFDPNAQSFHVVYDGETLTQDVDYTVSAIAVGENTAYVLSGCNLFGGKMIYCPDTAAKGWFQVGSTWYYLENGAVKTDWGSIDGDSYYFNSTGAMVTGWMQSDGNWYYLKPSGAMAIGWIRDGGCYYYFDGSGIMVTGWIRDGGSWYYLKPSGAMATGWHQIDGVYYYFGAGGAMYTGWLQSGSTWYYLKPSGAMAAGWCAIGGEYYYFNNSGAMVTGWIRDSGSWYYMQPSGMMHTGWLQSGGSWYYMRSSGAMATGWCKIGNDYYYIGTDGVMQTGWISSGGWYYLKSSGIMATGWLQVDGTWYYFHNSGQMATGTVTIDGTVYQFASSGAWIS